MSVNQQAPDELQRDHPTAALLRKYWDRLNVKNEHWMHCIVGREGMGKSFTALKLADLIDPDFSADQVIFRPENFLKLLKNDDYAAGDVFVLDEAGVGLGRRTWQEKSQVKLNQALQLIRDHNIGLVFTLPRLQELDSQTIGRLHSVLEIMKKEDGEYVTGNWFEPSVDRMNMSDTTWWRKAELPDGGKLKAVRLTPPEGAFVDEYQRRKRDFQKEFYQETIEAQSEDEEEENERSVSELVEQIKDQGGVAPYLSYHGGHNKWVLSKERLRVDLDLTHRKAKRLKDRLVEDPSIDVEEAAKQRDGPETDTQDSGGD